MIEVTARNNFSRQTTVVRTVNVVDTFQNVQFQCPAASVPGTEIVCRGEWRAGSGTVQFRYGDGLSENVYFGEFHEVSIQTFVSSPTIRYCLCLSVSVFTPKRCG
jgi:hypothetical protein